MLTLRLAWSSMVRNPVRTLLAACAMIAAASVVSWLVAGYDNMFSEMNHDPDKIEDRFDLVLLTAGETRSIDPDFAREILVSDSLDAASLFAVPVRVNVRKVDDAMPEGGRRGGGRRGGPDRSSVPEPPEAPRPASDVGTTAGMTTDSAPVAPGSPVTRPAQAQQRPGGGLPGSERKEQNLLSIVLQTPSGPGGRRPGGGGLPPPGSRGGGELAPVVYGLPTGGGIALQGVRSATAPYPMENGEWLSPEKPGQEFREERSDATEERPVRRASGASVAAVFCDDLAKRYRLSTGDFVDIASNAGFFRLRVIGIMTAGPSARKFALIPSEAGAPKTSSGSGIYVSWRDAARIAGGEPGVETIFLNLKDASGVTAFAEKFRPAAEKNGLCLAPHAAVLTAMKRRAPEGERGMGMAQAYAATGISMLVSFFIIFTTLSMGVEERTRQFAILRTVALRRGQIAAMLFWESLFLGLVGWIGGLISGWLLKTMLQFAGNSDVSLSIGFWTITLTGLCSVVGALAAAVVPVFHAVRIRPLDAMSPLGANAPRSFVWWPLFPGIVLLAVNPLLVAFPHHDDMLQVLLYSAIGCPAMVLGFVCIAPFVTRVCETLFGGILARVAGLDPVFLKSQLRANFWRSVGTVVSLSIGLGFFMMVLIWSASMLIPYISGSWMPDYFVSIIPGGLSGETAEKVASIPGVKADQCLPIAVEQLKLKDDLTGSQTRKNVVRQDNVVFCGVDVPRGLDGKTPLFPFEFVSENRADALRLLASREQNYCLIPHYFADIASVTVDGVRRKIRVGDTFDVLPLEEGAEPVKFRVAGIVRMMGWHWFSKNSGTRRNFTRTAAMLFADYDTIVRNFNLDRVNYLWMNLEAGADESAIKRAIEDLTRQSAGEPFQVRGMGTSTVGRETVRPTSKNALNRSLSGRTHMIVDGMLRMPLLILLVVSLSVANTAFASVRARRREIGIMRSVGLSSFSLFRMVLAETVMIALAASLLSLGFGIFAGLCSAQMASCSGFFGGMGWAFDIPWIRVAEGMVFTLCICLIASLIPAVIAGRTKPLKLLQNSHQG